jgi:hypothetical protein
VFAQYPITAPFTLENIPYYNNSFDCGGQTCGTWESAGRRPMLGVSVFVPWPRRIALRASPLYQRLSWSDYYIVPGPSGALYTETDVTTANRWDIPVSARWRFTEHINAGVGGTLSTLTGDATLDTYAYYDYSNSYSGTARNLNNFSRRTIWGGTAGIEFPFHTRIAVVAPDVEYTRWASRHYGVVWPLNRVTVGIAIRFEPNINFR